MIDLDIIRGLKIIACSHVLMDPHQKVRLAFLNNEECQLVCGKSNHSDYTDFSEVTLSNLLNTNSHIKFIKFPPNTNTARYIDMREGWEYTNEEKALFSPIDSFPNLTASEQKTFLSAIKTIEELNGFWVVRGPNFSLGAKTLDRGNKYVPVWTAQLKRRNSVFSKIFRRQLSLELEFTTIESFEEEIKDVSSSYNGVIINHHRSQISCPFEDIGLSFD